MPQRRTDQQGCREVEEVSGGRLARMFAGHYVDVHDQRLGDQPGDQVGDRETDQRIVPHFTEVFHGDESDNDQRVPDDDHREDQEVYGDVCGRRSGAKGQSHVIARL